MEWLSTTQLSPRPLGRGSAKDGCEFLVRDLHWTSSDFGGDLCPTAFEVAPTLEIHPQNMGRGYGPKQLAGVSFEREGVSRMAKSQVTLNWCFGFGCYPLVFRRNATPRRAIFVFCHASKTRSMSRFENPGSYPREQRKKLARFFSASISEGFRMVPFRFA